MTAFLASVVDAAEAAVALDCGADIVDCTDPSRGALGAPTAGNVSSIAARVAGKRPVSAAAGAPDLSKDLLAPAVAAMSAAGADIVKVGVGAGAGWRNRIAALAPLARRTKLVGVFFADRAPDFDLIGELAAAGFAGAMLDTVDKTHGRFLETLEASDAARFIESCRNAGLVSGVAGSLEPPDVPRLVALSPDFLGFRAALCGAGDRRNALDRDAVAAIRALIDAGARHDAEPGECDRIFVRDFLIDASIGVYNYEKGKPQRMRFNVEADVPRASRVRDDFRDVVSYDVFIDAIRLTLQSGHVKLVETVAEEVAAAALRDRRVKRVRVRVEKLDIIEGSVGVEIERRQTGEPARSPALARLLEKFGHGA
ncbi:MAG: dihydroneopterin aldolase [Hyphomicrobiales bacterium]|nr:dihydroneopterin aldolase [Hyphomicrobiales bacterium]